jgi:hypothetical protein
MHINRLFDVYAPEEVSKLEADLARLHQAVITARGDGVEEPVDELLG